MSEGTSTSTAADGMGTADRTPDLPDVRFSLPAVPANVALVRQALAGFADSLRIDPARAADMKIAITEACTNAVVHAYENHDGPLDVTMAVDHERLVLTVRDRGHGLRPLPSEGDGPPLGFGLALIASLSDEFGIAGGRRGTEVRIAFDLASADEDAPPLVAQLSRDTVPPPAGVSLSLAPGDYGAAVLGRVVSLVAARADFSIDRLSDAQIVSDAIAGAAGAHALDGSGRTQVELDEHDDGFDLVIGPLVSGGAQQLVRDTELPGLGCLLERLADQLAVEQLPDGGERLRARLATRG
ncbi:ATP-binding protein [Conexibacter sp. JD483]|uniref:ATP-binding protein n=1 Tax=unclassified Conexibacter TaxID=2627773 RepID=UPI00271A96DA|nr:MULTISPECIES: ATP-binding protein [unclassified Conexibacter]MDO8186670.1 ATP-binding protein [Conexibacter sp. CPCC 205706]MDO8200390.1 ATP-binding protein [Conexibacter sp. CPCC 205762]MDR9370588.1 ATP-binding protein [Conexibacter sp. JD483]